METKVAATQAATAVSQLAFDACGRQTYGTAVPIERHVRDGRATAVMALADAILRNWIGVRVRAAGFDERTPQHLSDLHTLTLM
jgi:alkylation response protein AidB-like acyl-CoA dehydrogenase